MDSTQLKVRELEGKSAGAWCCDLNNTDWFRRSWALTIYGFHQKTVAAMHDGLSEFTAQYREITLMHPIDTFKYIRMALSGMIH